jgi:hypothetical protein
MPRDGLTYRGKGIFGTKPRNDALSDILAAIKERR